jgi:hypothetical protein
MSPLPIPDAPSWVVVGNKLVDVVEVAGVDVGGVDTH